MRAPSAVAVGVCTGVSAVLIESDQARKTRLRSGKPSSMVPHQAYLLSTAQPLSAGAR